MKSECCGLFSTSKNRVQIYIPYSESIMIRRRVYEIIEQGRNGDRISVAYDVMMLIAITVSIVPLMFVEDTMAFRLIEQITVSFFILDYLLRWITADYRLNKGGWSFILYPLLVGQSSTYYQFCLALPCLVRALKYSE